MLYTIVSQIKYVHSWYIGSGEIRCKDVRLFDDRKGDFIFLTKFIRLCEDEK